MRFVVVIGLALLAACGTSFSSTDCPVGEDLLSWVWPVGSVQLSQCNRVGQASSGRAGAALRSSYQGGAAAVTLSARFEILAGAGRFEVFAGKESGPIVNSRSSGSLSVTGQVVDGVAPLALWGLGDDDAAPMQWRVSNVQIFPSP